MKRGARKKMSDRSLWPPRHRVGQRSLQWPQPLDSNLPMPTDADRVVEQLESSLLAAGEYKRAAEEATAALDGDLSTQLAALTKKQSQLEDELSQVDQQLAALGDGSVEQGLLRVANARAAQAEANALRARLHQATRNMPDLGRRLRQPSGRDVMDTTVTELDAARQGLVQAQQEQRTWQAEREHMPGVWMGVDEPIRRFLLYGGHTAERFVVKAVTLYSSYHRDAAPQTIEIDLPPRVLDAFDEWYRQRANRDSSVSSGRSFAVGGRAGNPFIYLDVENQAVMLRFPTQSLVELPKADRAWLEVTADNRAARSERWPLRAYRGHDRILQTQELAVPLPTPAQAYRLHLISGEEGLRTWALPGFADRHCLVFDAVSGQLLLESELAHGRVHAVLHRDFRLEPGSAVLDSFSLYNRVGFRPRMVFQDMLLAVPETGLSAEVPGRDRVRPANLADVRPMRNLERELVGIERETDLRYFVENPDGHWHVSVIEAAAGGLDGFLVSIAHPALRLLGPGAMRSEADAVALIHAELDRHRGHSAVWLVPSDCGHVIRTMYGWGAVNCELHFGQSRGAWTRPDGIVMPTFMPETG